MAQFPQEGFFSWLHWLCSAWSFSTQQRLSSALFQRRRGCPRAQKTSSGSSFLFFQRKFSVACGGCGWSSCRHSLWPPPDRGPALADLTSLAAEYFVSNPNHHAQPFLFAGDFNEEADDCQLVEFLAPYCGHVLASGRLRGGRLVGRANAKSTISSPIVLIISLLSWSSWSSSLIMFPSR